MIVGLTFAVLALALAWALWCAVSAIVGQAPTIRHRIGLLVLEAVALVQALVLVVGLVVVGGRTTGAVVEIVGYLIATLVVLPIGAALAHGERTRYGSVVLAVAGVTLAVLSLRTGQVWTVTGA
ncbi:hypothetical protein Acsp06_49610 [Actinomycetospora sp. NBRC 106375]|uniref:hypothetical protein n=1 Tax=Actinomycetospora sp. NBRC 106375 TaxID=3032207 RepID=UPI0024A008B9|nr:hypothetical protein [Actinomycetospora sp. NBRC 106375]GLZ48776.1 hypothetical protein Acsp06_49610 [Actinomycetospora sp. NBRC 106375]